MLNRHVTDIVPQSPGRAVGSVEQYPLPIKHHGSPGLPIANETICLFHLYSFYSLFFSQKQSFYTFPHVLKLHTRHLLFKGMLHMFTKQFIPLFSWCFHVTNHWNDLSVPHSDICVRSFIKQIPCVRCVTVRVCGLTSFNILIKMEIASHPNLLLSHPRCITQQACMWTAVSPYIKLHKAQSLIWLSD